MTLGPSGITDTCPTDDVPACPDVKRQATSLKLLAPVISARKKAKGKGRCTGVPPRALDQRWQPLQACKSQPLQLHSQSTSLRSKITQATPAPLDWTIHADDQEEKCQQTRRSNAKPLMSPAAAAEALPPNQIARRAMQPVYPASMSYCPAVCPPSYAGQPEARSSPCVCSLLIGCTLRPFPQRHSQDPRDSHFSLADVPFSPSLQAPAGIGRPPNLPPRYSSALAAL